MTDAWFELKGGRYPADAVVRSLEQHMRPERMKRFKEVVSRRLTSVVLGIEDLHHEHNGAACLRTAEGLGVHHVMAAEVRNSYPISKAISMSSHQWIEVEKFKTGVEMVHTAQERGFKVYGAGPRAELTLLDIPADHPVMILFGNEALGLQDETMKSCDELFRVPMYGFTESFNISVSVGMVLEQLCARVRARLSEEGRVGELSQRAQTELLAQWSARDMREIDLLLKHYLGAPSPAPPSPAPLHSLSQTKSEHP